MKINLTNSVFFYMDENYKIKPSILYVIGTIERKTGVMLDTRDWLLDEDIPFNNIVSIVPPETHKKPVT